MHLSRPARSWLDRREVRGRAAVKVWLTHIAGTPPEDEGPVSAQEAMRIGVVCGAFDVVDLSVNQLGAAGGGRWWQELRSRAASAKTPPAVLAISFTLNLLSLALPLVLLQIYDRILPNKATDTLIDLVMGLGVVVVDGLLRWGRTYISGWRAMRFEHIQACRAVDHMLAADLSAFERDGPGVHLDRVAGIDTLRDFYSGQALLALVDLPFVFFFIGLIWVIGGGLVAVPLILLSILMLGAFTIGKRLRGWLERRAQLDDRRFSFVIETLGGIHTVKGLAMEALMQRRYERLQESSAETTYQTILHSNLAQGIGGLASQITMVAMAAAGAASIINQGLSIGELAACTLLAGRSVQPVLRALGLWTQFQNIRVAGARIDEIFALPAETGATAGVDGDIEGAIEFDKVSVRYGEDGPWLLDKVDLKVTPGEMIGISGDTGSGKSTLLQLIIALRTPTRGRVLIDGIEAARHDPHRLRQQIAYVPQSAVMLRGTIMDNLTMFRGGGFVGNALAAARLLGLDEVIHRLPDGYNTLIGSGSGVELPGGVRQRISIARAFATGAPVILFDEAINGLDSNDEQILKEAFIGLRGSKTIILVSHRPSILKLADRVFRLTQGSLELQPRAGRAPSEKVAS